MQLILTIFHHLIGPKIYLAYPDETDKDLEMLLGQLLDLNGSEDQFSEYRDTQLGNKVIYNYKFSIPSEWSRGRKEMAMYAIISEKPLKLNFYQKHIDELVREFKQSPHFYKAFYKDERRGQGVDEQYGLLTEKTEDLYCFLKTKIKQHHIVRKIKENLEEYALNIVDLQYEKHPSLLKTFTKRQKAYTIDDTKHYGCGLYRRRIA